MRYTEALADFVDELRYEDLSEETVEFTKLCILDWLGSAIAGAEKAPIQKIHSMIEELGGSPQATLITGGSSSVANAALVNGAASHIVELDDIHKGSIIHAATVVIPAAFAIAEWKNLSGKQLITAVVAGYDVCYRIGEAVSPSHYYYWHNTATCGTFGAAAAAGKLLNLSKEQIDSALGSAGTQAAGLWQFIEDGAMSKQLHPGKAAMNGVYSALLASRDFTAAKKILEGKQGFFEAMSDTYDVSRITDKLGIKHKIVENSFKVHASCRHTHHVIDLVLEILGEVTLNQADVKNINIGTYQSALTITDNSDPQSIYASKFSIQFCAALALVNGKADITDFTEEALYDPTIREVMKRINVNVDEKINAEYPAKWGAQVEIALSNGDRLMKTSEFPKGDPENPVTDVELSEKFSSLARDLPKEQVQHYLDTAKKLEFVEDISTFFYQAVKS